MNFNNLNIETWRNLDSKGSSSKGYKGTWLATDDGSESGLHIFKDEAGNFHFALEVRSDTNPDKIVDPKVNGLNISLSNYLLDGKIRKSFIDIRCNINGYLPEFTKVTKDICAEILVAKKSPVLAVNQTVKKWIVFWDNQKKKLLSEQELIGLICELATLKHFCTINSEAAISAWVGPLEERHDFVFDEATIEVKGTRSGSRTHTINGIEQLTPVPKKQLLFISYLVSVAETSDGITLPNIIDELYQELSSKPELIVRFNELLSNTGYSPLNNDDYSAIKFLLFEPRCYYVDNSFPFLNLDSVSSPLIERISSIRYDITLDGLPGKLPQEMDWFDLI